MAREKPRNSFHPSADANESGGRTQYPVGEYGRDFIAGQDRGVPSVTSRYPVGEFGRDYDARDLQSHPGARDLTRSGGMNSYEIGGRRAEGDIRSHRGRGPKGYRRSDHSIHDDLCTRLTDDHLIDASEITVTVQGGEVTLSGTVESRDQKRRAELVSDSVSGVRDVHNQLRVQSVQPQREARSETANDRQRELDREAAKSQSSQAQPGGARPTHH